MSQAAAEIGVSENTLRRAEKKGRITPERRPWGNRQPMRLYRKDDLPGLRKRLGEKETLEMKFAPWHGLRSTM